MSHLIGGNEMSAQRKRRASDKAGERVERATDAGDTAAERIAGGQLEALLRERAAYRRPDVSPPRRRFGVREDL